MRDRMWSLRSLASATALVVLAGGAAAQGPGASGKPAAVVNGQPITYADLESVLKLNGPMPTQPTQAQYRQMQSEALDFLIDERVMEQFMRANGPKIDPKDVAKQLAELESALKAKGKTLDDYYKDTGLTEERLRINILNRLQKEGYLKEHLTEAVLKRYYEANRDFFDQVSVKASHIVIRLPASATPGEHEATRAKLQALREDIVAGRIDFAEAAKKYSQCPSAPRGGDIGYFPRKWAVDEAFARTAFSLKVGEISNVVQTEYGLHLIKVTDRKQEGPKSEYDKVKDEVRETASEDLQEGLLARQRKAARIEINLPAAPAKKRGNQESAQQ